MCWFCDDIKKFINKSVVVYDDATASVSKEYSYPDSTVTLKITAGGYRGKSHILMGMLELKGLKYCPNCGEKIGDFDNCASKENDKVSCEIEKLKMDVEDLKKDLVKMVCEAFGVPSLFNLVSSKWSIADEFGYSLVENYFTKIEECCSGEDDK